MAGNTNFSANGAQSLMFLLDPNKERRDNAAFLFRLKNYLVEEFGDFDMAMNRMGQLSEANKFPFCIVINVAESDMMETRGFLKRLNDGPFLTPVLIIDRDRLNLRREVYLGDLSPQFPLFICRAEEMVEFSDNLHILRHREVRGGVSGESGKAVNAFFNGN